MVWEKTVLDDCFFSPPSRITVGESPSATFTVATPQLGKRYCFLHVKPKGIRLFLKSGMVGEITIAGQKKTVEEWISRDQLLAPGEPDVSFDLTDADSGILVFNRVGLMFQVVPQPQRIPSDRMRNILGTDPFVAKAFGSLMFLLFLLSFVSRLMARSPSSIHVEQLPDRFVTMLISDPKARIQFKQEMRKIRERKRIDKTDKSSAAVSRRSRLHQREEFSPQPDRETAHIRAKVSRRGIIDALGTARKRRGALQEILNDEGLGNNINDAVLALEQGAVRARLLTTEGRTGVILQQTIPSQKSIDENRSWKTEAEELPRTGDMARRMGSRTRLARDKEKRVEVSIRARSASVSGGTLSKKEIYNVVMRNKGAIRYCYESQLMRFPTLRGKVEIDFIISREGSVQTVKVINNQLSEKMAKANVEQCLVRMVKRWIFPKPEGGKVRVVYPFTFGRAR